MALTEQELALAARRAYERGRVRLALPVLAFVVPVTAIAMLGCNLPAITAVNGGLLAVIASAFVWRGGPLGRAVWPGLLAGFLPFALPLVVRVAGHAHAECTMLPWACGGGGLVGGVLLGFGVLQTHARRLPTFLAAALIAALTGTMGCVLLGFAGIGGMALALVAGATPVVIARRARA